MVSNVLGLAVEHGLVGRLIPGIPKDAEQRVEIRRGAAGQQLLEMHLRGRDASPGRRASWR